MNSIKKIVIIGPESTGKTTLCEQLAQHYHTVWCKEFARTYLHENGTSYSLADLLLIAKGQLALEDHYISTFLNINKKSNDLLESKYFETSNSKLINPVSPIFFDTDLYVIKVWSEYVFGSCDFFILDQIVKRKYDAYLLCNIDLPWVKDELREYPNEKPRQELFSMYKDILVQQSTPWAMINGSYKDRLQNAITIVDGWL